MAIKVTSSNMFCIRDAWHNEDADYLKTYEDAVVPPSDYIVSVGP